MSKQLENKYYEKFINKEVDVLIEKEENGVSIGHTSNYLKVYVHKRIINNTICRAKVINLCQDGVIGEVVDCLIVS